MNWHPALFIYSGLKLTVSKLLVLISGSASLLVYGLAFGAPNLGGQEGYINMPNAYTGEDGTWSFGFTQDKPYSTLWTSATLLPALQGTARYVNIAGIRGFADADYGGNYGDYKDKVFDVKLQLRPESRYFPAVAVGRTDLFGTGLFKGDYIAATKQLGGLEASVGYGKGNLDGAFAGARWSPRQYPDWSILAEYDARNYQKDYRANETFASERKGGLKAGLEYRWGWLSLQGAYQQTHSSINAMVNIPLNQQEFVPKFQEPAYYTSSEFPSRPSAEQWRSNSKYGRTLQLALQKQDFTLIKATYQRGTLRLSLGNSRISNVGRAVGRAVRTALYFTPLETRSIKVTYTELDLPVATYEFFDMAALQDYLSGKISRERFNEFVLVRAGGPMDRIQLQHDSGTLADGMSDDPGFSVIMSEDGDFVQLRKQDSLLNRFKISPKLGFFFNDPSGALHYELGLVSNIDRRLGEGLYFNSSVGATVLEDVSAVKQPSNSLLPHVRSDVAEYKRGGKVKLFRVMLNQYYKPATDWYARASAGLYEEMFAGTGGQVLFAPSGKRWAVDLSMDAVRQRDYKGWLGMRDYQTITSLASLHYRLPYGVTATARAGRFLAKDNGIRLEFKRRFRSKLEIGAWYTRTDGKDITSPGTPSSPYNDKGIFISIPLDSMLTVDSRSKGNFSISPWTRDVGQMVASPGDLYGLIEEDREQVQAFDGLGNFAEHSYERGRPEVDRPIERFTPWPNIKLRLEDSAQVFPALPPLAKGGLLAGGAIALASLSDKKWDSLISQRQDNRGLKAWNSFGKAAPWLAVGGAGTAFALGDERLQNTGFISLQSALAAGAGSMLLKQAVGRSRPEGDNSQWDRISGNKSRQDSSFPSNHAAVTFAALTPFASEYDAPWLYGVATAAALGRTAGREHWLSDTAAGGLLGHVVGQWLWTAQRQNSRYQTVFDFGRNNAGVTINARY